MPTPFKGTGPIYGNARYNQVTNSGAIAQNLVRSNMYPGYAMGFYWHWPKSNPIPPVGNPFQRGIVAGVMFDPAPPYKWTQQVWQVDHINHMFI
jgi:hypothetical protein